MTLGLWYGGYLGLLMTRPGIRYERGALRIGRPEARARRISEIAAICIDFRSVFWRILKLT